MCLLLARPYSTPLATGSNHAGAPRALGDLLRARQMRHVHHLPLPRERAGAAAGVLLEGGDELDRLLGVGLARRELRVDHLDLARVNRDLAAEPHGDAV